MYAQNAYLIKSKSVRYLAYFLYLVFSTLYILAGQLDISQLRTFKVFPLGLLILLIIPEKSNSTVSKLILAIVLGIGGDLFLQYGGLKSQFFAVGAGLFLLGHLLYNICILQIWHLYAGVLQLKNKFLIIAGTCFLLSCSVVNLSTTISDKMRQQNQLMVILMPVYLIALTLGCVNIYNLLLCLRKEQINRHHILVLLGTVMFCISDNVLGRTIFADFRIFGNRKFNSLVIMVTYYLGQLFINISVTALCFMEPKSERGSLITNSEQ